MYQDIALAVKKKGIIKIDNFISHQELNELKKIVLMYKAPKNDPKSYFPTSFYSLSKIILKLNLIKLKQTLVIWNLKNKKKFNDISDSFFSKKSKLYFTDAYYSKASKSAILPWHTDQAYHGELNVSKFNSPDSFFLKFFIYLTDVGPDNGCMSYVEGSHKLGYAIRKSIFEKKISYQPYWSLKDFRKILSKNRSYFDNYFSDKKILDDFFEKTNNLDSGQENLKNSEKFSYHAKAGSLIIFDEGGVHQGSKPQYSDRMVLRYLYSIR